MALPVGSLAKLTVRVELNDSISLLDVDLQPIGQPRAVGPRIMAALEPVALAVAVGDVMQDEGGMTAVARWVDPADPTRWSPSTRQDPSYSGEGWTKIGTATLP